MPNHVAPKFRAPAFSCPFCEVYATHDWWNAGLYDQNSTPNPASAKITPYPEVHVAECKKCGKKSIWYNMKMMYPCPLDAPPPTEDMPADVLAEYEEARQIVSKSPKAAAALLRLAVQKLMPHLGEKGENINSDIASLVKKGLSPDIQQALDSVRIIGNNAVHPGTINLNDDPKMAFALFDLLNIIVAATVSQKKKIKAMYDKLPDSTKDAIQKRDGK